MQPLRTGIVYESDFETQHKSALSKLLKETLEHELESDDAPILNVVTMEMAQSVLSGATSKLSNFNYKFKITELLSGIPLILVKAEPLDILIKSVPLLKVIFSKFKIELSEEECFVLFSLHNNGQSSISLESATSLLEGEWKIYERYKLGSSDRLDHVLTKLSQKKIISFCEGQIKMIEEIKIKYK